MITYQTNQPVSLKDSADLYTSVGWTAYTNDLERLKRALANSLTVITAWQDKQLLGLVRAVGDGETILYIQDILVRPTFQKQGVGSALMTKMLALHPNIRQKVLLTEEAPDVRHFYEKFGFISCDQRTLVAFFREH